MLAALLLFAAAGVPVTARADSLIARGFVNRTRADVYGGPGWGTGVTDTLGKGVSVSIFRVWGEWLYVTVPSTGRVGYVYGPYVSIDASSFSGYGLGLIEANVHMRKEPTSSSKSMAICHTDDVLIILSIDQDSGWYHVKNGDNVKGYVSTKHCRVICKAERSETPVSGYGYVNRSGVNFRTGPGTDYTSLGKLQRDTVVQLLSQIGTWYQIKVRSTGKTGYIYAPYVTKTSAPADVTPVPSYASAGYINYNGTNIRSGPGTEFTSFGQLTAGTELTVLASEGNWYRVRLTKSGLEGYVYKPYVTLGGGSGGSGGSSTIRDGYINASGVRLRSAASTSSEQLGTLARYTTVRVLGSSVGDWYNVFVPAMNTVGFVYAKYVTIGSSPTSVTPAPVITPPPVITPKPTPTPAVTTPPAVYRNISATVTSVAGLLVTLSDGNVYLVNSASCVIINPSLCKVGMIATINYSVVGGVRVASRAVFTAPLGS